MKFRNTLMVLLFGTSIYCSSPLQLDQSENVDDPTGYFESSYGKIAYYIQGKGTNLVLLHAAGHDHKDFDAILPELIKRYRVISIDWPGHGNSIWTNDKEISATAFPALLKEFLEGKEIKNSIILGNSVGGYSALQLAIDNPNLVKALVLVDTGGMNDLDLLSKVFITLKSYNWFTYSVWNMFPKYYMKVENEYTQLILHRIQKLKENKLAIQTNSSIWKSFLDENYNQRGSVSKIKQPTLIIWGSKDPVIHPRFGIELQDLIKNSELKTMEVGHLPFAENPDEFMNLLTDFLIQKNL
ncbi:MAG: alpha/beta hydrolase [Leptospiraceae bacterium]|nr:alpha/beta hydrolase [Leptospiraceae bacterium]